MAGIISGCCSSGGSFFRLVLLHSFTNRKEGKAEGNENESKKSKDPEMVKKNNPLDIRMFTYPLVDFAIQHGNMQVKTMANPTTNEVRSFCVFTNEQGIETVVYFSQELGPLRPQEIAERKEHLVVVQKMDGTFELE